MNFKMIGRIIAFILLVEAIFMIPAMILCGHDGDTETLSSFLYSALIILIASGILFAVTHNAKKGFFAKEGLICVGLSWIMISFFGALPLILSGSVPSFIDALFETVSGFTTTGASVIADVEALSRGILYWRSFTNWLGGMGVLVFLLAIIPISGRSDGFTMHLLRAESPGPGVEKLVPRIRHTAFILYFMYLLLTLLTFIFLMFSEMDWFESLCAAFSCAGTGGFSIKNDSIMSYSPYVQNVCTVFMFLFGVNFSCYYLLLRKKLKNVLKDEELRLYLIIIGASIAMIFINILSMYPTGGEALRHASFQVGSILSTTGFSSTDFDLWPSFSKAILFILMLIGACGGSTAGGFKCGRVVLLFKSLKCNIHKVVSPNKVQTVRLNGNTLDNKIVQQTNAYLTAYVLIILFSIIVISIDNFSFTTNVSAVVACFNNIGPGFEVVGPTCTYASYSALSKFILIINMLAGRLEIFPILALASRSAWKRG